MRFTLSVHILAFCAGLWKRSTRGNWRFAQSVCEIKTKSQSMGGLLVWLDDEFAVGLLMSPPFQRSRSCPYVDQKAIPGRVWQLSYVSEELLYGYRLPSAPHRHRSIETLSEFLTGKA